MRHKYANNSITGGIANGLAIGLPVGLAISGASLLYRHLSKRKRERKLMNALEKAVAIESAKDQLGLSSNMFMDRYPSVKHASFDWKVLPAYTATAGTALLSAIQVGRLLDYFYEKSQKDYGPGTIKGTLRGEKDIPKSIVAYRDKHRKEYEDAVKLLRAVTDDSVVKNMKTAAWTGYGGAAAGIGTSAAIATALWALSRSTDAAIQGFRENRDARYSKDVPYVAWLAARQDQHRNDLRAFIEPENDSDQDTLAELQAIADAYNKKYSPEPVRQEPKSKSTKKDDTKQGESKESDK